MTFKLGTDQDTELTAAQLTWQYKMYIAALRISDDFGLDAVGIQYQQGLKDLSPASDLVEGLLNNVQRPPATGRDRSRVLYADRALPNFNEADEGIAVDSLITNPVWIAMDLDPAKTLHDVRWGEQFGDQFVWVYEVSGSVPPSHLVVELPESETERRSKATNPEWPIAQVVPTVSPAISSWPATRRITHSSSRPRRRDRRQGAAREGRALRATGLRVHLCGTVDVQLH